MIDLVRARRLAARTALVSCLGAALAFGLLSPALVVDDSPSYLEPARSFAAGRGLLTADGRPMDYRLPLYPIVLGLALRVFGDGPMVPGALNAAFHVLSLLIVRRVLPRRPLVDLIIAVALVWPPWLTSSGLVLQEPVVSLTLALAFVAGWRLLEAPSVARGAWFGLACGLSALAKVTVAPACAGIAMLCLPRGSRRAALFRVAAVAAGFTLMILPWGLRNLHVMGRFQVANPNGGANLLAGTVSNVIESWSDFPEFVQARERWDAGERQHYTSFDDYLYKVALDRIQADPLNYLRLGVGRAVRFMLPARHWFFGVGLSRPGSVSAVYVVGIVGQGLLFGAAAWLAIAGLRSRRITPMLATPVFVFGHQALYAATHASPRYGATVAPVLLAALVLVVAGPGRAQRGHGAPRASSSS